MTEALAKANSSAEQARDALTSRDKGDVLNSIKSLIADDYKAISHDMLSNMVNIGYNEDNTVATTFKYDGAVVANSVAEFESWAKNNETLKHIMKGVNSSGAGTTQSTGGAHTTNKKYSEMTLQEKIAHNSK